METKEKTKKTANKENTAKAKTLKLRRKKSPIDLFGIFKDKIFYESDEVLMS